MLGGYLRRSSSHFIPVMGHWACTQFFWECPPPGYSTTKMTGMTEQKLNLED